MGLLTFSINLTLDGCVDHQEGIADDETHAFFTRLMDENGAMLWGRVTYEMMERYWPTVASGEVDAPAAIREWAVKLEDKPKYVASTTRTTFPWTNSHHLGSDLHAAASAEGRYAGWRAPRQRQAGDGTRSVESDRRIQARRSSKDRRARSDPLSRRLVRNTQTRTALDQAFQ